MAALNSQFLIIAVRVIFGFALAGAEVAKATPPTDACSLLTAAQLSAAPGATVDQGKNTPEPSNTPLNQLDAIGGNRASRGSGPTRVQFEILDPTDRTTPVERFNDPLLTPGMTNTHVSGVGDAAYYLAYGNRVDLSVKKGSSVSIS